MSEDATVIRTLRRYIGAALTRNWEELQDALADDFHFEDRRPGLKSEHGKAADLERSKATVDLGLKSIDVDVVELRGERLALVKGNLVFTGSEFVIDTLLVLQADDDGRWLKGVMFDGADLDAALAELDGLDAS